MFNFFKRRSSGLSKLLISIGAGFNQLPLIEEARRKGFIVIGIDQNPSAAGLLKCDIRIQESIYNHELIYRKIQELLIDGVIKGALTRSYGEAVLSTARLNEHLGVAYIPSASAELIIDKKKMKQTIARAGLHTPACITVDRPEKIKHYPCVLKPLKGHAKQGVRFIRNITEAKEYFSANRFVDNHFLSERFIEGDEIIAAGICIKGRFSLIEVSDKILTDLPYFVDVQHTSPSKHDIYWTEIERIGQTTADAFHIVNSPLLLELRIDRDGGIHIIEVIPEFGGEFIADVLIPARTGCSILGESINALSGSTVTIPPRKKRNTAVIVKYITAKKDGTLSSITPLPKKKPKGIIYSAIFKDIGAPVSIPSTNHDRIGVIIAKGKTAADAERYAAHAEAMYAVKIKEKKKK